MFVYTLGRLRVVTVPMSVCSKSLKLRSTLNWITYTIRVLFASGLVELFCCLRRIPYDYGFASSRL